MEAEIYIRLVPQHPFTYSNSVSGVPCKLFLIPEHDAPLSRDCYKSVFFNMMVT